MTFLAVASLLLALIPAVLFRRNLSVYRPPPALAAGPLPAVSVLIPARNEAAAIQAAAESVLASVGVELELLVLDDQSSDDTAARVRALAARDDRVALLAGAALPAGWAGKQFACFQLACAARHDLLVFMDADVRLTPAALRQLAAFLAASGADLASGIPRQETGTALERLLIPLIHFLLLGFLPLGRMRRSVDPAYAAGCGQLFIAQRTAYREAGGHEAIRASWHDGIRLPRAFRAAGLMTDLCDVTDLARCRMYHSAGAVWHGLAKNAGEGLASPRLILPATVLLGVGQVLPFALLAMHAADPLLAAVSGAAVAASYYPRWLGWRHFHQDGLSALLHPLGVLIFLAIQWFAFLRGLAGQPPQWKGRVRVLPEAPQPRQQAVSLDR